jgi:hypothetical protein
MTLSTSLSPLPSLPPHYPPNGHSPSFSLSQNRLDRFVLDAISPCLIFFPPDALTERAIIQAAKDRMAVQLQAFDDIFDKPSSYIKKG